MYNNPYTLVKHAASILTFLDQIEPLSGAMELQFLYMFFICYLWKMYVCTKISSLSLLTLKGDSLKISIPPGGGVLPYIGYIGLCGAKGYGFLAILVWNRVSIWIILVWNRVWFVHSGLELGMFFRRSYFFIIRG